MRRLRFKSVGSHEKARCYGGESLSSWCFRLAQFPEVQQYLLAKSTPGIISSMTHLSILEFEQSCNNADFDFIYDEPRKLMLMPIIGGNYRKFLVPSVCIQPVIPWQYRRSYCSSCISEALRVTRAPILKSSWRNVFEPFCIKHGELLRDAPPHVGRLLDGPRAIFKWHHMSPNDCSSHEEYTLQWAAFLRSAEKVQRKIKRLLSGDEANVLDVSNTILALMRALLNPGAFLYDHLGARRLPDIEASQYETMNISLRLQVFRASSASRARALFYVGVVLGWIKEKEIEQVSGDNYYAPKSASDVWGSVWEADSKVYAWLRSNLHIHQNNALRVSLPN